MKKYRLLYFVSEDDYFLTHKFHQAKDALNDMKVLIVSNFNKNEKKIKSAGFDTYDIKLNRRSLNPISNLITLFKLIRISNNFKPDIIQCIALKPIILTTLASIFFNKRVKIICCVVGLGYLFINKGLISLIIKKIYFLLIKLLSKKKVKYIFQNKDDLEIFKTNGVLKISSSRIIKGSGVDLTKFRNRKTTKKYDLIFHSRVLKDKGIYELVEAIKILRKQNIFFKTLILGSPDPLNRSSLKKKDLLFWVGKKLVVWKPKVKNVLKFLHESKIAILPSYREGLPKSLLEAASCELPIISTNVTGCKEICIENYNGYLANPRDPISLSKAIKKLVFNKDLINKFGKNSRILVKKRFSNQIVSNQFKKVYKEFLK